MSWRKAVPVAALAGLLITGAVLLARGDGEPPVAYTEGEVPAEGGCKISTARVASTSPLESHEDKVPVVTVNSRRIRLNYEIREVGHSGVSSVELWATRDGKTWQRYSNEPPPPGPLVIHVAEEGRYGFTLLVKNGIGLSGRAPMTGDQPQVWVDVDETKPVVKLMDVVVAPGGERGDLAVHWVASDAHLLPRPISIATSTDKDGPWTTIASGLENTGRYTWKMPADVPHSFYVRVEAADRAGNVASAQLVKPVVVDSALPRGVILGVDCEKKDAGESH
jgi:hypothetical protein